MGLIFSCENENHEIFENYSSEVQEYLKSNSYNTLSTTFPMFTKGLDYRNITEYSEKGILSYSLKSKVGKQALGVLYFSKNVKDEYQTILELYSYDRDGNLKEVHFNNILGQEMLSASLTKISRELYSFNIKKQPSLFSGKVSYNMKEVSWWSCTRGCIGDAWGLCADDPECDYLCGLAGGYLGCAASIATACSVWCAEETDHDLTPEFEE